MLQEPFVKTPSIIPVRQIVMEFFELFCLLAFGIGVVAMAPVTRKREADLRQKLLEEHPDLFPTKESLNTYLAKMNQLSELQQQLHGIEPSSNCHHKRACTCAPPDFGDASTAAKPKRADELPYLYEGDIVLSNEQLDALVNEAQLELNCKRGDGGNCPNGNPPQLAMRHKRTLTSSLSLRWTSFPIPYVIGSSVNRTAVAMGIANWERSTCLTFRQFTRITSGQSGLQFTFGAGCFSSVGRVSGRSQQVSIGNGCSNPFVVSHEIAHALGFFHEQSRWDRDSFVSIQTQNILASFLSQFTRLSFSASTSFGVEYDLGSVMHYDSQAFANGSNPSILLMAVDANYQQTIGQRFQLSFNDVKKMNFAYCNSTCPIKLRCLRSGYTDPKDCSRCRCPDGLTGQLCDRMLSTTTQCSGQLIRSASMLDQTLSQRGEGNCNFLIKAPANSRVLISVDTVSFDRAGSPCPADTFVEIRYHTDLGGTGARLCQSNQRRSFVSDSFEVLVLFRSGSSRNQFSLRYRSVSLLRNDEEIEQDDWENQRH